MEPSAAAAAAPAPLEPWVWLFLQTEYYKMCATHEHINNKNTVCNHFCIDCVRPICQYCTSSGAHAGHRNLQIRRASKACSVDTASLSEFIDVSGLHKFKINGFSIHFLVPRRPEGSKKKAPTMEDSSCDSCGWTLPGGVAQGSKFCSISCKFYPGQQLAHKSSNNPPLSGGAIFRNSSAAQLCTVGLEKYRKCPAAEGGRGGHGRKRARSEVRSDRSTARAAPAQKNLKEKKGQQQEEYSKIIGLAVVAAAAAAADCRAATAGLDANSHVCIRVHRRKGVPHRSPLF